MSKYTCERSLKEFSQKSYFNKHQNKKIHCCDKGKIKVNVENIINKKLISNKTRDIITNTMESQQKYTNTMESCKFEKMKVGELRSYCKKHKIKGFWTKKKRN